MKIIDLKKICKIQIIFIVIISIVQFYINNTYAYKVERANEYSQSSIVENREEYKQKMREDSTINEEKKETSVEENKVEEKTHTILISVIASAILVITVFIFIKKKNK